MIIYDDFNRISPPQETRVPEDRRRRNPLIHAAGFRNFMRLKQHRHAPKWNFETGDRINQDDLEEYLRFGQEFASAKPTSADQLPDWIRPWLWNLRPRVRAFQQQVPEDFNLEQEWERIPTLGREDLQVRIHGLVPLDADLSRLIVYDTSGSTGHAVAVPHHPVDLAKSMRLMEYVLARFGVASAFSPEMTACLNVSIQADTVVYPNIFSVWNQAGFAKINLDPDCWRDPAHAQFYLDDTAPAFLTGDPLGFAEMLRRGLRCKTYALMSTAMAMPETLRNRLEEVFQCPVIDWYAATETGPIAYACPLNQGFHILPRDLFVEILDPAAKRLPPGEYGEITVSGGRNPFLPLLRYRTGDHGRLTHGPCPCGDPMPRLIDLRGRPPVIFLRPDGTLVNPVDVGRLLRNEPIARHHVAQHADHSVDVHLQPIAAGQTLDDERIRRKLMLLFGEKTPIRIHFSMVPNGKYSSADFTAYRSEFILDDFLRPPR